MPAQLTRRDFLKIGSIGLATTVLAGCQNPRRWVTLEPYVRPPEEQLAGVATWYASTCRQCPAGCGILVRVMNGRALKIEGNPEHPLNQGKLCARGQAGLQLLYNPDRLTGPVSQSQRGSRDYQPVTWDNALQNLTTKLQAAGNKVAVWAGSTIPGHLYDLLQRYTTAAGAPAPIVNDLYSGVNGYPSLAQTIQGSLMPQLPAYAISQADVVYSFGADFLGTWLSAVRYGIEYGNFRSQERGTRGYLVQFEPRLSITGAKADRWEPIKPGSEALVAQAILRLIADLGLGSAERVQRAQVVAGTIDVNAAAAAAELPLAELKRLAEVFAKAERPVAIPGGTLTGQNGSAQAITTVQALNWVVSTAPAISGLNQSPDKGQTGFVKPVPSAYSDVLNLINGMNSGGFQVLLVVGANPVYDLPDQTELTTALGKVPFIASFTPILDETSVYADLVLPDRTYLESWGYEVVAPNFGTPAVTSQQPVVSPFFDGRSAADVLLAASKNIPTVAAALPWTDEVAFMKNIVGQLPGQNGSGTPDPETAWANFLQHGGWWASQPPAQPAVLSQVPPPVAAAPEPQFQGSANDYPFFFQPYISVFLGDGRGACLPWLQGSPDPLTTISWQTWVELHPDTAARFKLKNGDIVKVTSQFGSIEAPVYIYPAIRPDTVGLPFGQGHTDLGRYARGRGANLLKLTGAQADAAGKALAWASLRVNLVPTGRHMALAAFENSEGVNKGFSNQAFPGQ